MKYIQLQGVSLRAVQDAEVMDLKQWKNTSPPFKKVLNSGILKRKMSG